MPLPGYAGDEGREMRDGLLWDEYESHRRLKKPDTNGLL